MKYGLRFIVSHFADFVEYFYFYLDASGWKLI